VLVGVLVAWVIVFGTVAPFGLVLLGLRLIGATRTGLVGTVEPVLAGFIAWVVLAERLAPVQVLGAAVVLAGIVVAESARAPRPTAPASASAPASAPALAPASAPASAPAAAGAAP
jgi:drug/metabolite transporter (DMT)-like permease